VGHEVGNNIAKVCSLCELGWGKKRKDGTGFARQGGVQTTCLQENEGAGGAGTGTRAKNESRQVRRGKRGVQCKGEASAAPCHSHTSTTHVGPAIDSVRRTRSDSDPASVERSSATGAMSKQVFQLRQTTRGLTFPCRSSPSSFPF
jgi:hypothetical protein